MVFGAGGRMYILLLKWGFRSFVRPFAGVRRAESPPKTAGAAQIILKFPLRFLQKALAFLGGIRYA